MSGRDRSGRRLAELLSEALVGWRGWPADQADLQRHWEALRNDVWAAQLETRGGGPDRGSTSAKAGADWL